MTVMWQALYLLWQSNHLLRQHGTMAAVNRLSIKIKPVQGQASLERLIKFSKIAQSLYPRAITCLPRSMALWGLLSSYQFPAVLCVGARREPPVFFHAWVEVDDRPVTDDANLIFEYHKLVTIPSDGQSSKTLVTDNR